MKKIIYASILFSVFIPVLFLSCAEKKEKDESLVIYSYDSFVSEWGPGPVVIPMFEEKYKVKIKLISAGDSGQLLSRLIFEKDKPEADIVIGLDNNMLHKAVESGVLASYKSPELSKVNPDLLFDRTYHLTPFDYGYFSIIYDSEKIKNPPDTLEKLLNPEYEKSIILMDPRTSGPGLGFLLWTISVYGEKFTDYWEKLEPNILTITDGWSSGYGLFVNGEAPFVLSYTTSPAYHKEYEDSEQYKALIFKEGNYMHIEGAGIVKSTSNMDLAEKFIDFMLSEDFQAAIPLTNWMFPVIDIPLPDSFSTALKPEKHILADAAYADENIDRWINQWLKSVTE